MRPVVAAIALAAFAALCTGCGDKGRTTTALAANPTQQGSERWIGDKPGAKLKEGTPAPLRLEISQGIFRLFMTSLLTEGTTHGGPSMVVLVPQRVGGLTVDPAKGGAMSRPYHVKISQDRMTAWILGKDDKPADELRKVTETYPKQTVTPQEREIVGRWQGGAQIDPQAGLDEAVKAKIKSMLGNVRLDLYPDNTYEMTYVTQSAGSWRLDGTSLKLTPTYSLASQESPTIEIQGESLAFDIPPGAKLELGRG